MKIVELAGPPGGGKTDLARALLEKARNYGLRTHFAENLRRMTEQHFADRVDLMEEFGKVYPDLVTEIPGLLNNHRSRQRRRVNDGIKLWTSCQYNAPFYDLIFIDEGFLQRNAYLAHNGSNQHLYPDIIRRQPVPDFLFYLDITLDVGLERAVSRMPPDRQELRRKRVTSNIARLEDAQSMMLNALDIYKERGVPVVTLSGHAAFARNVRRAWRHLVQAGIVPPTPPVDPLPTR